MYSKNVLKECGVVASILCLIAFISFFAPKITSSFRQNSLYEQNFVQGTVLEILENNIEEDPFVESRYTGNQKVVVRLDEGVHKGEVFTFYNTMSSLRSARAFKGLKAIFTVRELKDGSTKVWLYNYKRTSGIYMLVFFMCFLVLSIGRIKGLRSLLSLAVTGVVLLFIVVPGMWSSHPILLAILSAIFICIISFILIAGFSKKAFVACGGTIAGILLAGIISYVMGKVFNLSGVDMDKGESLMYLAQNKSFKISSILFVSILISSLGATMDIAISIASSSEQLQLAKNDISSKELFISLMSVGKDIIGTMTNTLILAFCGSSLPMAMMIWGYNMPYNQFMNISKIVINILQALSGSIGMVASVFFTAVLSVVLIKQSETV